MPTDFEISGKDRVLAATVRVILRDGILALTLDGVAKEAGLSKGGLLYHFASKELLIRSLLEQFIERFEERMARLREADAKPAGRWTRAFLKASSEEITLPHEAVPAHLLRRVFFALLATMVLSPSLNNITQELSKRWWAEFAADGVPHIDQMLLVAASDGILFWEMIRAMPADDPLRPSLVAELQARAAQLPIISTDKSTVPAP